MSFYTSGRLKFPGLVQPYNKDENNLSSEQESSRMNRMNGPTNRLDPKLDHYSIYDGDSTQDHYFLVPGEKLSLTHFRRTFIEMNKLKSTQKSSLKNTSLNNNNTQTLRDMQNNINNNKHRILSKQIQSESGEYCLISQDATLNKNISLNRTCLLTKTHFVNKESLNKYASKLVTSSTMDHIHSFDKQKKIREPLAHIEGREYKCRKKKRNYRIDKCIDICTCMVCVKAVSYHWTADDTDDYTDPCSCTGTSKNIVGRWLCMSVLALFLPCIFCYLPARSCQKLCSNECSRTKLKSDAYQVRYTTDRADEHTYL